MPPRLTLFGVLLCAIVTRRNQALVEFLLAEKQVLRDIARPHLRSISDAQRRSLGRAAKEAGRRALLAIETTVHPDTLLRWYRQLVAAKYTARGPAGRGRPRSARDRVRTLVLRFARENPSWGYTRLRDALTHVGVEVGRNTIARALEAHGVEPAPSRKKGMAWTTFLRLHWGAIAAADFFSVEVLTTRGLVRYMALIVIDLKTRRIELAGLSRAADGMWMQQVGRNLTDAVDGFLLGKTKLIVDRDPLYTADFRALLKGAGVETIRLPRRSPNLNAFAERAIRSIKEECLAHVIPLGEQHLRSLLSEYLAHYHAERNHQGLGGRLIDGAPPRSIGTIKRKQRLGGLLNHCDRDAA